MVLPPGTAWKSRAARTITWAGLGLLALLLIMPTAMVAGPARAQHLSAPSMVASSPHATPFHASHAGLVSPAAHSDAAAARGALELHRAVASLSTGAGPAFGTPVNCKLSGSNSASCGPHGGSPAATGPAVSNPAGWQNASPGANFFGMVGPADGASMAWDPADGWVVYFGGCEVAICPDNQTWVYFLGTWFNDTNYANAPPAVFGAMMDYDYQASAVMLFGGVNAQFVTTNQTWTFVGGTWTNHSAPAFGSFWPPAPRFGSVMAFANDSLDNETVLFGGCLDVGCFTYTNDTWLWVATLFMWVQISTPTAPDPRTYSTMAYAGNWGSLLLFGGCDTTYACGASDTWQFYNGSWTNLTAFNAFFFATPGGRGAAMMTYDTVLAELLLFGGESSQTGVYNDVWAWSCSIAFGCGWGNVTPATNLPYGLVFGTVAAESSTFAPLVYGGQCLCPGAVSRDTWVFEPVLTIAPTLSPSPSPARVPVTFSTNAVGGTQPWYINWQTGDGNFLFGDGSYAYPALGTYQANMTIFDYYGVMLNFTTSITVTGTMVTLQATPVPTDIGVVVLFSTPAATGGTSPYVYNWTFGDGSSAAVPSVSHTYTAAGTFMANLSVVDANGLYNNSSMPVVVAPAPAATAHASLTTTDVGVGVSFSSTQTGGVGTFTYAWTFGDGSSASTAAPTHTFASASTFHATVVVTDALGVTASANVDVKVYAALAASASANPTAINAGSTVAFTGTASGGTGTYTYFWAFGDGGHDTVASPSHVYQTSGSYTAKLWVNDTGGGSVLKTVAVTVQNSSGGGGGGGSGTSGGGAALPGWALWAVLAVIILVIVVVAAVLMMRRRKPGAPADAPPVGASGGAAPPGANPP